MRLYYILLFLVGLGNVALAQEYSLKGLVIDGKDKSPMIGATVMLKSQSDTTATLGNVTDFDGLFNIKQVPAGQYQIIINYLGYEPINRTILVNTDLNLDTL